MNKKNAEKIVKSIQSVVEATTEKMFHSGEMVVGQTEIKIDRDSRLEKGKVQKIITVKITIPYKD